MTESVRQTWGRYAGAFAAEAGATERESIRTLVAMCELPAGALVLDVATGAGYAGFVFAAAGARVIGLDPTHEMLLASRRGWSDRELPGAVDLVEAWAEHLPFADGCLDAVVSHRAPHQFADQAGFIAEARRILRPGGVLGIADQSPPDGWEDWHNDLERMRDPTHEQALSMRQWKALVDGAGMRTIREAVVYQGHDVEDWCDRVSCPEERRAVVRDTIENMPDALRQHYEPRHVDGRLHYRSPQSVLIATS